MNRTSANNTRRRTTRHLFDDDDEPPAKKAKTDATSKGASQHAAGAMKAGVNGKTNGTVSRSTRQKKCKFEYWESQARRTECDIKE